MSQPYPCPLPLGPWAQIPLHLHWWTTVPGTAALLAFLGVACEAECAFPRPATHYVEIAEVCSHGASWILPLGLDPSPPLAPVGACVMVKASLIFWLGMVAPIIVLNASEASSRAIFMAKKRLDSCARCGWKREVVVGLAQGALGAIVSWHVLEIGVVLLGFGGDAEL